MNSIDFRLNSLFSRNSFDCAGRWQIPIVEKQDISIDDVQLIAYSDTRTNDTHNCHKGVHFFIDDYRFEGIYRHPEKSLPKLSQYKFLLTPDYSTYSDMNYWRQLESVAHNRWVGAYWQDQGQIVIPTISWSDRKSYEFCFDGVEENSIVAIGMIGCKHNKKEFLDGYVTMLEKIKPSAIICFGKPFEEMTGILHVVDYIESRKVAR